MSRKIDHQLFSAHEHALEHETCPQCDVGELHIKNGKHGPFLGCNRYPECDYIKPLHQNDGHIVKALGVACPECGDELLLRQGRYGMFIGCSAYPTCSFIESPSANPVAEKQDKVACPECGSGHIKERKTRFGKVFYACDNYPQCKFSINRPPISGQCQFCGFGLLMEKKSSPSGVIIECAARGCHKVQE